MKKSYAEREDEAVLAFAMSVYTDPSSTPEDREAARQRLLHPLGHESIDMDRLSLEEKKCLLAALQRLRELQEGKYDGEPLRLVTPEEWPLVEMLMRTPGCEQDGINPNWIPEHERAFLNAATRRIRQLRRTKRETPPADPPLRMMTSEEAAVLYAVRLTPHERRLALVAGSETAGDLEELATVPVRED